MDLATDESTELTDQNHVGGLPFVKELAQRAGISRESKVLDLGSGLGGAARALAYFFGCNVHGIDLSPKRYREAVSLTELVGLSHLVSFECGDFLSLPVPQKEYDVVWGQGSWIQAQAKGDLVRRWSGALRSGGTVVLEDSYLKRVPDHPSGRLLVARLAQYWKAYVTNLEEWIDAMEGASLTVTLKEDLTSEMINYFSKLLAISQEYGGTAENESAAWKLAVRLGEDGVLGYVRLVARFI